MTEETDFVLLWKEQYEKIDQSLVINKWLLKEIISQKAAASLQSLMRFKIRGIVAAIIYLFLLAALLTYAIYHYSSGANYFILSIGAIFLVNIKALYDYCKHLVWVSNIDYSGSITDIQEKLAVLQLSILRHCRLLVLQFPFWTTFYLSDNWFPHLASWGYIITQVALTIFFIWIAYYLYKNLTMENAEKKWVKALLEGSGGKSVIKAISLYRELQSFR